MKVHFDEGLATHIGLEPCVFAREGEGEASVEVRIGQPLSCERTPLGRPTVCVARKATVAGALLRVPVTPGAVIDPGMCVSSLYGNREIPFLSNRICWFASGR